MPLDVKIIKKENTVCAVELTGSLDNETHHDLEQGLNRVIDEEINAVIIDMAGVE